MRPSIDTVAWRLSAGAADAAVHPRRSEDIGITLDDRGADVGVARPFIEDAWTIRTHSGYHVHDHREALFQIDLDLDPPDLRLCARVGITQAAIVCPT